MKLRTIRKIFQMLTIIAFAVMIITGSNIWLLVTILILASITLGISIKELKG